MQREDWLLQRIEELARFLASALGRADAEQQAETRFEAFTGMTLPVLRSLSPAMAVRLLTIRYGEFQVEAAFTAWKLLELHDDPALAAHRDALYTALVEHVGHDDLAKLETKVAPR